MDRRIACIAALVAFAGAVGAAGSDAHDPMLTEFGATWAVWRAHHTPDLRYGACCYLPRQRDGTDRYYGVGYSTGPHIDMFEMSFVPTYPVRLARQVVKFEAGPGARLVYDLKKASCEQIEYRSTLLSQAVGGAMSAERSRNATGYAPEGHVGDIIFQALPIGAKYPC